MEKSSTEDNTFHSFTDSLNYETCSIILELLEKAKNQIHTEEDELKYKIAENLITELRYNYFISDVNLIIKLVKEGYLTKAQVHTFFEARPEISPTLGKCLLLAVDEELEEGIERRDFATDAIQIAQAFKAGYLDIEQIKHLPFLCTLSEETLNSTKKD